MLFQVRCRGPRGVQAQQFPNGYNSMAHIIAAFDVIECDT